MEHTLRLLPRHQVFFDLACQIPEVDTTSVGTYLLFLWVARDVLAAQQTFYDRFELSEGKLVVLLLLHQAPHYRLTPSALAEAAGVTRGTITGLLVGLERSGLVKRTEHPEDGRMFTIELTQQALNLFEQIMPERFNHIREFMSSLTEEEQHQLRALLEKMNRGLPALSTS
ncbi:MAG: MarR family winged helix-turn-helix transcriptional regulator [Ktedonobacteraceae bacterium]|jgi:DNA-binding MarR family transcriptional regulator